MKLKEKIENDKEENSEEESPEDEKELEEKLEDLDLTIKKPKRRKKIEKEILDDSEFARIIKEEELKKKFDKAISIKNLEQEVFSFSEFEKRTDPMIEMSKEENPFRYNISEKDKEGSRYLSGGRAVEHFKQPERANLSKLAERQRFEGMHAEFVNSVHSSMNNNQFMQEKYVSPKNLENDNFDPEKNLLRKQEIKYTPSKS